MRRTPVLQPIEPVAPYTFLLPVIVTYFWLLHRFPSSEYRLVGGGDMITELMGLRIKQLRDGLGESQETVANRIGMARSYFGEIEIGHRNVSARNLLKIANGLGVTLEEFFDSEIFDPLYEDSYMKDAKKVRGARTSRKRKA